MKTLTKDDIVAVVARVPMLNEMGVGIPYTGTRYSKEERAARLAKAQERLLDSVEDCNKVCVWLSTKAKIKTVNKRHTSYGLKHIAEEEIGYVMNGVFIAAAIHLGFPYQLISDNPNVYFGISEKSLLAYRK